MQRGSTPEKTERNTNNWCSIVGAPRCGTTSLARYLSAHPDICFSNVKEPHFFSRHDLRNLPADEAPQRIRTQYLDRFFPDCPRGTLLADGSVSYLYAPEQMLPVLKIWPDAKFIIAVRNPLDMLPSLHQRQLFNGDETVRDFGRAWALVDERRRGKRVPRSCIDPRLLDYKEIGLLGKHVRRFVETLGKERCFISLFDDLIRDPEEQYRQLLEFLGLPWDGRTDFGTYRSGADVKILWLQRLLKRPPRITWSILAADADVHREGGSGGRKPQQRGLLGRVKAGRKRLLKWNRKPGQTVRLSPELRGEMCDWFREDVSELSEVLGRDLSHWLVPGEYRIPYSPDSGDGGSKRTMPSRRVHAG